MLFTGGHVRDVEFSEKNHAVDAPASARWCKSFSYCRFLSRKFSVHMYNPEAVAEYVADLVKERRQNQLRRLQKEILIDKLVQLNNLSL